MLNSQFWQVCYAKVRNLIQEWNHEKWNVDIKVNIHTKMLNLKIPLNILSLQKWPILHIKYDACRQAEKDKLFPHP